jgi:hypothetical protein
LNCGPVATLFPQPGDRQAVPNGVAVRLVNDFAKAPRPMSSKAVAMTDGPVFTGGCACGQVRFRLRGAPKRVGLCHCMTCRKAHAAAFNPFVVYDRDKVEVSGDLRLWRSSPGYDRRFCGVCGSRVLGENGAEIELSLGSLDEPGVFAPQYESWTIRREPWLPALDCPQFDHGRTATAERPAQAPAAR